MADRIEMAASKVLAHNGTASFDCDGAQVRALWRQLAIVVTVSGTVHAGNVEQISKYTRRFALAGKPVVLDMSTVASFAAAGVQCLYDLDEDCCATGMEWALIASPAVTELLDARRDEAVFPTMPSIADALHHLADAIVMRRQLLMPLLSKTA